MRNKVLLSFDIEEFDLPREYGVKISTKKGVEISSVGLEKILKMLKRQGVRATFFVTGNFANYNPELVRRIRHAGHEVGCHGVNHSEARNDDIARSKKIIETTLGEKVYGYRQPRMQKINYKELGKCGFLYDSSVNPAFIPGRYNHFNVKRTPHKIDRVLEIPTSVASAFRVPLFWLALHLFPNWLYMFLAKMALKKDGYLATYFHPWEFTNLKKYNFVPSFIKYNSNNKLLKKLEYTIVNLKCADCDFMTYREFAQRVSRDGAVFCQKPAGRKK